MVKIFGWCGGWAWVVGWVVSVGGRLDGLALFLAEEFVPETAVEATLAVAVFFLQLDEGLRISGTLCP